MSIKNRHTMAAFLVAILCITTIFSLFSVTSFAACSHSGAYVTYLNNNGDGTHTSEYYCPDCLFTWDGMPEGCTLVNHGFYSACSCGYTVDNDSSDTPSCSHPNPSSEWVSNNNGLHYVKYYCDDCDTSYNSNTSSCDIVNGVCKFCGYVVSSSHVHNFNSSPVKCVSYGGGTHIATYVCGFSLSCDVTRDVVEQCKNYEGGYCLCGYKVTDCIHLNSYDLDYRSKGDRTHDVYETCYRCSLNSFYYNEACIYKLGKCILCGHENSDYIECDHIYYESEYEYTTIDNDTHMVNAYCHHCKQLMVQAPAYHNFVDSYKVKDDDSHIKVKECLDCGFSIGLQDEEHTFDLFTCIHCRYVKSKEGIYEDVPENAKAAYVYQDDDGNWLVKCNTYYGGVNRLNLLSADIYVHNTSSVKLSSISSNDIVIDDLDGAVNKSNSKIIDVSYIVLNSSFEEGEEYKFVATVDSTWSNSQILLKVSSSAGTKYLSPGGEFVYEKGMSLGLNIKTNSSTTKSYGLPFTVTITDIGIIPSGEYYEPYGIRYFNGDLSLTSYQNLRLFYRDLGRAFGLLDYIGGVSYGNTKFSSYKDLFHMYNHYSEYSYLFDLFYWDGNNLVGYDVFNIYDKFVSSSDSSYNLGYSDGYSSAVQDFDGVTDGGMVEGIINGGWRALFSSWNVLSNGITISGVSLSSFVSSLLFIAFGGVVLLILKIFLR